MAKKPVDDFWDQFDPRNAKHVEPQPAERRYVPTPRVEPVSDEDDVHAEARMERDLTELAESMEMLAVRIANRMYGTGRSVSKSRRLAQEILDLREHYRADCLRRRGRR